jgi:hypothetical protein
LLADECIMDIAPPRGVTETKLALPGLRKFERAPEIGDGFLQAIGERDLRFPIQQRFALERLGWRCRGSSCGSTGSRW